jgi:protein SCO1/2
MKTNKVSLLIIMLLLTSGISYATTGYQGVLLNPVKSINSHNLMDHTGAKIQFPQASGKYQLVFFGYTSCPDICPTTLHKIKHVMSSIKNREDIDFYFISIDSERDKPKYLREFLDFFHPDIKGLTGSVHNIKKVEKEFGILTRKFQGKSALAYKLEHSVFMYLINGEGKLMLMYPGSTTSGQIISDLNKLLKRSNS